MTSCPWSGILSVYPKYLKGGFFMPGGRPRGATRTVQMRIRCTPEEKERIDYLAANAGLTVTAFLIGQAIGDGIGKTLNKRRSDTMKKQGVK